MQYFKRILYIYAIAIVTHSVAERSIVLIPVDDLMIPIYVETTIATNANIAVIDKSQLLALVNEARTEGANCGGIEMAPVDPLTWNDKIENAALTHSIDMDTNDFFSHTGSDGSDVGDRFDNVGYTWSAYGENIAKGYTSEESVIAAWLNSPGHCQNIMRPYFTEMGVSKVGSYWTQDFGDTY